MSTGRRWLELQVASPGSDDPHPGLAEGLLALGGRAVEERDGTYLTHLEEPEGDLESFLADARRVLESCVQGGAVVLRHRWQRHEDWAESWKRGLGVRRVTPRLVVTPSWIPVEAGPGERVVVVDPGMAFGTAEHATTRGCLRLLDRAEPRGARLLDLGAGSGILTIGALLLEASETVAVEGDDLACEALRGNLQANGVAERVDVVERWADEGLLAELGGFDLVLANLEWPRLQGLLAGLLAAVLPGGAVVVSGLQDADVDALLDETGRSGFVEVARDAEHEWHSLLLRRPVAAPDASAPPTGPADTTG